MSKEVYIRLKDGEKESELRIESIDPQFQLAVMDGLFKFFNVDVDFKELADIYHRSGKAYQEFYEKMDADVNYKEEEIKEASVDAGKYIDALKETVEETVKTEKVETEIVEPKIVGHHSSYDLLNNDYFTTGIKYDSLGKPTYKCRYKCPSCNHEANHYIKPDTKHVRCWECNRMLKVKPATAHGGPDKEKSPEIYRDLNGNFYIAGSFELQVKTIADAEQTITEQTKE